MTLFGVVGCAVVGSGGIGVFVDETLIVGFGGGFGGADSSVFTALINGYAPFPQCSPLKSSISSVQNIAPPNPLSERKND